MKIKILLLCGVLAALCCITLSAHEFNGSYRGAELDHIAMPVGGIGTGMFCFEGTGAISHMSVRHSPELFHEPCTFAAVSVKGLPDGARDRKSVV